MKKLNSSFKKTLLASLVVPFVLSAQTASAAELVTNWGYKVDSTLAITGTTGGTGVVALSGDERKISWGDVALDSQKSSIEISDVEEGSGLITNAPAPGGFVDGGVFTHTNNVLPAQGDALSAFNLTSVLTLTPFAPSAGSLPSQSTTFQSFFLETGNGGTCLEGSATVCDDVFTLGNISALGAIKNDDGSYEFASSFNYDGYAYTVFLQLVDLGDLKPDACDAAGSEPGCVGLLTPEGGSTDFATRFRITGELIPVPEPGTLALLGLGIAGLSMSRRKSAAK